MAKALLLNHGGYDGLKHLEFPIEVEAHKRNNKLADVKIHELVRVGFDWAAAMHRTDMPDCEPEDTELSFWIGHEIKFI